MAQQTTAIDKWLNKKGYTLPNNQTYQHIAEWLEWYQNDVENFHKYKVYNGISVSEEERFRLGMAKTVCEDWANLILNEKVDIHADQEAQDEILAAALERNNFSVRANQLVEIAFALGTGAIVAYKNADGEAELDYIRADMIKPLSWTNGDVTECAFGSERVHEGEKCVYIQIHRKGKEEAGEDASLYYIENHIVEEESQKEHELDGVEKAICTGRERPFFHIITPNIYNNIELESPLGISVYGNATWALKGADLVFDSYMNEFILGRKRVLVGQRAVKRMMERDGVEVPMFDTSDKVYVSYTDNADEGTPIKELDMSIRAAEHESGIQRTLDIISTKCGMGNGRYRFESNGVKTATEIISSNSDLYRNLKKHELVIRAAIVGVAQDVLFIETGIEEPEIVIDFDDSIIIDTEAEKQSDRADVAAGIMQPAEYRAKYYNETLEEAAANLPQASAVIE